MPRLTVLALAFALAFWIGLWADEGCGIDPSGLCAPAPSQDAGCIIDPNGGACPDRQ